MTSTSSPQGFIRALKAESDPPSPGSQYKIDIAHQAWNNPSLYIPNKPEVIAEWILGKFLKEKDKEISSHSIVDLRFWTLLRDVMLASDQKARDTHTRRLKLWLPPLLGRIPLAPILCSWLDVVQSIEVSLRISLSPVVCTCLETMWPLAVQKLNLENLLECFSALIGVFDRCNDIDTSLARIGVMVVQSYRQSFANSVNKKKVCFAFMRNYIPQWLRCINRLNSEEPCKAALDCIYQAGIDTIFNLEILCQRDESSPEISPIDSIAAVVTTNLELSAVLPRLFASYIDVVTRHRGTLALQGSTKLAKSATAEIQAYAIPFLTSCFSLLDAAEQTVSAWASKVALLSLVYREDILDYKRIEAREIFGRVVNQALAILEAAPVDAGLEIYAIESLSSLCRIDYDLVIPVLPFIVPKLLLARSSNSPAAALLDLILEYHIKTRTLDVHIETILSALLPHKIFAKQNLRERYESPHSGPLFDNTRLENLSKAIRTFLTSSQLLATPELTYHFLKSAKDQFDVAQACGEKQPSKRRKTTGKGVENTKLSLAHWAITFSSTAEIAIIVVSSLPISTATESTRQAVQHHLVEVRTFTQRIIKSHMKILRNSRGDDAWALSVVAAASFRLQYALDVSKIMPLPSFNDEKLCLHISKAILDEPIHPRLLVELFRFLFKMAQQRDQMASQATFDDILAYLEQHLGTWESAQSGSTTMMENNLILLHMIIQRWLPLVESFALEEQLERLLRMILSLNTTANNMTMLLQPNLLLLQALQSAHFLELPRLRSTFTRVFNQIMSETDVSKIDTTTLPHTVATYRLLLVLPVEYLSRSNRSESIRQALALDLSIATLDDKYKFKYEHLMMIRTFLGHIIVRANTSDQPVEVVCDTLHRLMSFEGHELLQDGLVSATLNLMSSLFLDLFKRPDSAVDGIISILHALAQVDVNSADFSFEVHIITRMVNILELNFRLKSFPEKVQIAMRQLHQTLSKSIESYILTFGSSAIQGIGPGAQEDLLILWHSLLSLRQWLAITAKVTHVGRGLVSNITTRMKKDPATFDDKISVAALGILLDEFGFCPDGDRVTNLELMLAAVVSLYGAFEPSTRHRISKHLAKICIELSAPEFTHVLGFISESLRTSYSELDRVAILRISWGLLHDHPQGTTKQMQIFITDCIHAFAGWHALIDGNIELRIETLGFLAQHCAEQPAILRLGDMGGIWGLLARFLTESRVHDDNTTFDIFHKITNIVSAVVRLRRDLVVHTLPQLCYVLRRLLLLLRTIRPNLGVRQTRLVTDTQPRWLNIRQPLGMEEARVLARLLESLTIKSVVRNNASGMDTQKAESLAKPLSKHAGYVLKAYITAINDPLCLLPLEHRKELRKGLFALCSMMSEHIRDAMMIGSLDAGGKIIMKSLWSEYEKQRYMGKG